MEDEEELKKFIAQSNREKAAKTKPGADTTHKAKIGRNDPCPCGSGKKYKNCCGKEANKPSPPLPPFDRRLMERDSRAIQKLLEGQNFESIDKMNDYLRQVTSEGSIPEWTPETPAEEAQELIYQALEATKRKDRIRLAMEALNIYQDCADAYVLLAEEAAEVPEQAKNWYQQGMEAGERDLGPEIFHQEVGNFWGIIETRPYMRAREGLADCLFFLGEQEAAIGHYRDMLRLNPGDNQGIRYKLLGCLMESSDIDAVRELLGQYEDEASAVWLFTRALVAFISQGDSPEARKELQEAREFNPHVIPYLLGRRRMPRTLPDYIGFGNKDEAVAYVADFGDDWRDTPGALKWLRSKAPESSR
jgi:tetratricopeptide (TPR) repeat protein